MLKSQRYYENINQISSWSDKVSGKSLLKYNIEIAKNEKKLHAKFKMADFMLD